MLKRAVLLVVCALLAACVNAEGPTGKGWGPLEVLDPAAYDPIEAGVSFDYPNLSIARTQLSSLAKNYAVHRDRAMEGTLIFDVPILGLAVTGAVGAANHFATTTTLGMLTASGGVLASRSYLGPSTKWAAYQGAENGLSCLSQVATSLYAFDSGQNRQNAFLLLTALDDARGAPPAGTASSVLDNAAKASVDLNTALNGSNDPIVATQISAAAQAVVQNATKRALTGLQDINALVQAVQKISTPPAAPPASSNRRISAHIESAVVNPYSGLSIMELTDDANKVATLLNSYLNQIQTCVSSSSS